MGPDQARMMLDRHLAQVGQSVTLQRVSAPSLAVTASVTVQAHIADYKPEMLQGAIGLQIGDSKMVMSSTEVTVASWPAAGASPIPIKGDRVVVAGRTRIVLAAWAAPYIQGQLVRIELSIR